MQGKSLSGGIQSQLLRTTLKHRAIDILVIEVAVTVVVAVGVAVAVAVVVAVGVVQILLIALHAINLQLRNSHKKL